MGLSLFKSCVLRLSIILGLTFSPLLFAQQNVQRVALVIGNAAYQGSSLANPVNDARAVAARLRGLGFDVTLRENLKTREIGSTYRDFRTKIKPGAVALVFYAGHGIQVKGQNYFPAVDSDIASEEDVPLQSLNLATLLDNMEEAKAGVSLVLLDACRDNPYSRRFRSATRGLAKVEAASGTLIHYATKPGSVAADGDGKNGTYTEALLAQLDSPLPVELMLKQVTNAVVTKTKGKQEPWVEGSLRGDFYFNGKAVAQVVPIQVQAIDPTTNDRALWETVRDSKNPDEIRAYLDQFPKGLFAGVAKARLSATTQVASAPVVVSPVIRPEPAASVAGTTFRDCPDCPEMVVIPAGSFEMGGNGSDEQPVHRVTLRSFSIGKTEVTQGQWRALMGSNPSSFSNCGDNCPVENVSWEDTKQYVSRLSAKTGKTYRLPSEAEWEYACRAGGRHEYCGSDSADNVAWHYGNGGNATHTVAGKKANAWGLHDMSGNVWEWTEDCRNDNYSGAPTDGSVWTSGNCSLRVVRGGSWNVGPQLLRAALRNGFTTAIRGINLGFRVARTD